MTAREVLLDGGSPWGFRMNGGADVGHPLRISRVNPGSKASQKGVREGDVITSINGTTTKCLTNGESHALLRSVTDSLRLGLNQDTNGSPQRRSKQPLKREASSSSTHSQSTPSTPLGGESPETPLPPPTPASPEYTSTPTSTSASSGAKVFVCGIWNSVQKSKQKTRNNSNQQTNVGSDPQTLASSSEIPQKTSSSKARRLRKLKLKTVKRAEEATKTNNETQEEENCEEKQLSPGDSGGKMDLVIVMDEEDVRRAGGVLSNEEVYFSETSETAKKNAVELKENNASKSKTKNNNKSKGFSLSNIFKTDKNHNRTENSKPTVDIMVVSETINENSRCQDITSAESPSIISTDINAISKNFKEKNENIIKKNESETKVLTNNTDDVQVQEHPITEENIRDNSTSTTAKTITIIEIETCPTSKIEAAPNKPPSPVLDSNKAEVMDLNEEKKNPPLNKLPRKIFETKDTNDKDLKKSVVRRREKERSPTLSRSSSGSSSRPISIFVVPPDNVAQEAEAPEVDWESVSDLETRSTDLTDDDDVRPETLIHLPSNDLQTSAAVKDGRNGIVQVDDYELSVRDLYTPFIDPEEEARLRMFLETLNLTKSEEYDDTSSSKSYGDSSSTTMSTSSPIPPTVAPSDEIVIYRHMKSHSVAEPCFIPSRNQRFLDVITEESSDPSDSEKRHSKQPWEDPDQIRKNNDISDIPNDWYGSDEEPETTSDEGGIVSWRNGKKLEDVDGVEVVYLSDSEDGDDEQSINTLVDEQDLSFQNKENIPELVVVHAMDNKDVKRKVNMKPLLEQQRPGKISMNDKPNENHTMEEIISILDSTYEINKDLFIVPSHTDNIKSDKGSNNMIDVSKKKRVDTKVDKNGFQNMLSGKVCTYMIGPEISTPQIVNYYTEQLDRNTTKPNPDDEVPVPEVRSVPAASPALSRQGSSSSATSQSTAKYNPQSPMSSEAEDKSEPKRATKQKQTKNLYNPKSLTSLSIDVIANLAHGDFYLNKICGNDTSIFGCREANAGSPNGRLTSLPPSGVSTRRSSYFELEGIHPPSSRDMSPSRPMLIQSPPPSALTSPPVNDDPWVGLPTSMDPKLLVCLSPSQSKNGLMTTPKEASELLELHKKFAERRGYHETNASKRDSICSPRSCNSPDLIRLDPYESNNSHVYTPELLKEAANLLALKEYRQSRFKSGKQSEPATNGVTSDIVLKKKGDLSEVTSQRTKIAADSEDPDLNRSAGTSRLLALIQEHPAPHSDNTACPVVQRDNMSDNRVQLHRYSGSYISEWLTISENVLSNGDISRSTNGINGGQEQRQFEADKYKISKQGDIAIIQTRDDRAKLPPRPRVERPKSLPPAGIPALNPSGGELFREQMYNEYMNKVAERSERRQQKVIKISSLPSSTQKTEPEAEKNPQTANQLECEFMTKARERMSKLGIDLDGGEQPQENGEEKSPEELPKHLQEFMELAAAVPLAEEPSGVWSPGATPEAQRKEFNFTPVKEEAANEATEDSEPVPPVWTPRSAQASPTSERKFRPVNFESPKLGRKTYNKPSEETPKPPTDLPLQLDSPSHSQSSSVSSSSQQYLSSTQTVTTHSTQSTQETSGRLVTSHSLPDTSLPRAQNPTITLLQKAREGQLPRGAHYLEQNSTNSVAVNSNSIDRRSSPPAVRPTDILYSTRREYESETEDKQPKKFVELSPKKVSGIGPTTKEGIPIVLRSEVQDENQQRWYKRMYDSLHRAERDKEYVTVRYKSRRGRYPYTSSAGYLSEPEPVGSYDSDYSNSKYATLDRRRTKHSNHNEYSTSTMPRSNKYNAVKHAVDVYKNQPGRIEDYEPGHSSIADKEAKQWWDEVMDIFDGQFEQTQKSSPRTHAPATSGTNKPFMTYALKESGYESDSTLVFKRRDETQQQLSPAEQKQAYKVIQKGGDVPLHGLRKPGPDKPKGPDESELEYFPISPHLTRIRIHKTKQVIKPVTELICYPLTSITLDKPPPVFASYKRTAKSSSNLIAPEASTSRAPSPPKRRSSHNSSTLKLYSKMSVSPAPKKTRLSRSLSSGVEVDSNVQYLKDRITSKLGVSKDSADGKAKKKSFASSTTVGKNNRFLLRTGSLSPSMHATVTAGPGATKITRRTSLERKPSLRSRRDLVTPARLAKSTELRAPAEVKKVLKQREVKERSSSSKSLPPGTVVKSSTTLYSSSRSSTRKPKEDKQLKVTVAISAKGRELLRSSSVSSTSGLRDSSITSLTSKQTETTISSSTTSTITATTSTATITTTSTINSTAATQATSSSPTISKSPIPSPPRPPSRSDSDKRPSPRSSARASPVDPRTAVDVKSPSDKVSTPSTVAVSPVPLNDLIKKTKKLEVASDVPKRKRDKNGISSSKSLVKSSSSKKSGKENDSESNGKRKSKKSKDGDSPPSSKKLAKKNGVKKSREKDDQKRVPTKALDGVMVPLKETKNQLAVAHLKKVTSPQFPDLECKVTSTKTFFQNLLLRNMPSPTPSNVSTLQRNSSVLERAQKFVNTEGYSSLPYKSEPSLRLINVYLNNKRPVSESKFRSLDREIASGRSSRSQSPIYIRNKRYEFLEKIDKFDKMNNVWDKSARIFSPAGSRNRSPELFNERSASEPPRASPSNELHHQETFVDIQNSHWDYDNMSPPQSRSPSCRRIRSGRTAVRTVESIGGIKRKGIRAKSLSEADAKRSLQPLQAHSTSSLNLSHITDHGEYQSYVTELLHSTKKSDRFKELHKFYASLERMGELERTTSNMDLRPRKKGEEIIDYDRWKQLRTKERAEEELKNLYEKLKEAQKEKDLLFQPRDSESLRWRGDRGLRGKEKSVEDLRLRFQRMAYEDSDIELCKRREIDATKDVYKPLWRGSSVVNLANTLTGRTRRGRSVSEVDSSLSIARPTSNRSGQEIGSRLWSSLSMEQVNALKSQLSEIYNTVSSLKRERINRMLKGKHSKDFEIVVPSEGKEKVAVPEALHVRCNSLLTKEQLYSPLNRRKESQRNECKKADSIGSIPNWRGSGESCSGSGSSSHSSVAKPLSEIEKKKLSMSLSEEVKNRVSKNGRDDKKKKRRVSSSIVIPRETMGAVAVIKGTKKSGRLKSPSPSDASPRTCYSIEMSEDGSQRQSSTSSRNQDKSNFLLVLTPKDDDTQEVKKVVDEWAENKSQSRSPKEDRVIARLVQTTSNSETDSGSSDASTVIHLGSREDVQKKVDYFEAKKGEDDDAFDGRVSRSAGDVRPFSHEMKNRAKSAPSALSANKSKNNHLSSQSFSDLKDLFGEKRASVYATSPLRKVVETKSLELESGNKPEKHAVDSGLHSSEESLPIRSRSISPDPMRYYRAYLNMVKAGDVRKLRDKFESLDDLYTIADEENLREPSPPPPKRYQSDPDLTKEFFARKEPDVAKTVIRGQEVGDVRWLKRRYETEPQRGRTKTRRVVSPVPLKSENRFMPHINVISKLASLQQQRSQTVPSRPEPCMFRTGEVDRLKHFFEDQQRDLSILGHMYTSAPDVRELRDIAPYLECNWVAHQHPKPRSLSSPETQRSLQFSPKPRPASSSPTRRQTASILKPHQRKQRDIFANQHFDPSIHRPLYRYQPPTPRVDTSYHYRPWTKDPHWWWRHWYQPATAKPTVTFKEPLRGPHAVPQRGPYPPQRRPESPHRYVESEVTIHYRSPVRTEEKEAWSEEELQRRQAEAMRRIYQEERRRKYLQELQDMYSRRHTDNFTPSQKSPIPLNRYDDFLDDLSPGKPRDRTPEPKLVARALYNFVGQTSRELTFRRGDIIYVRRQIDKNWYEGEHNAMIGLFPLNYVEIIPYDGIRTIPKRATEGQARAKFNFQAQTHLELPLVKGELVLLTRRVDNNWFEGRIGNRKGIFPCSYVEVLVEPGERTVSPVRVQTPTKPVASPASHSLHMNSNMSQHHYQPPRPVSYTSLPRQKTADLKQPPVNQTLHIDTQSEPVPYRVLYNYKPQNEDELELVEGETVYVMEKCDDGWYVGSSQHTGYLGTFPGNYVQRIV